MTHYKLFRQPTPAREVPVWEQKQRRILAEDREGNPAFVRAIQALQVSPRKVRTA